MRFTALPHHLSDRAALQTDIGLMLLAVVLFAIFAGMAIGAAQRGPENANSARAFHVVLSYDVASAAGTPVRWRQRREQR